MALERLINSFFFVRPFASPKLTHKPLTSLSHLIPQYMLDTQHAVGQLRFRDRIAVGDVSLVLNNSMGLDVRFWRLSQRRINHAGGSLLMQWVLGDGLQKLQRYLDMPKASDRSLVLLFWRCAVGK